MAGLSTYRCSQCGEIHEGSMSFGFRAPDPYLEQTDAVQAAGELGSDRCRYQDEDGWHRFIRVLFEVPIHGVDAPFLWGVWVSLSERSFEHYVATWDHPDSDESWFGWLCNRLPGYPDSYALKARVHPRGGGDRPWIELEETPHPLAQDFHHGISIERAQQLAEEILHPPTT